jgi:hypothetical protein
VKYSKSPVAYAARKKIGSQAKAPTPLDRKPFSVTVGQALLPANSESMPIFSQLLMGVSAS